MLVNCSYFTPKRSNDWISDGVFWCGVYCTYMDFLWILWFFLNSLNTSKLTTQEHTSNHIWKFVLHTVYGKIILIVHREGHKSRSLVCFFLLNIIKWYCAETFFKTFFKIISKNPFKWYSFTCFCCKYIF